MSAYECPLCHLEFEGELCHAACSFATGCTMVRCPRCSYEFVQDGFLVELFRRMFDRRPHRHASSSH